MRDSPIRDDVVVLVDIGSTFTKVVAVAQSGEVVSRVVSPTRHEDLAAGAEAAVAKTLRGRTASEVLMCSSAAGGLRVVVIGLEPQLTLEAGRRAAATAGARVVASFAGVLDAESADALGKMAPDVVLLAGGTNGGDEVAIVANARRLAEVLPEHVPVVVAGNETVSQQVAAAAGADSRIVRVVPNVLPSIGELVVDSAQAAIRDLFVEHVIGRGRFASRSPLATSIRMPTPAAVLAGTQALARLGRADPRVRAPVVVDVGGATTDVHSVQPVCTRHGAVVPDAETTRTVEGDLGLRESADSLVEESVRTGHTGGEAAALLREAAAVRVGNTTFVPATETEAEHDRRLATLAAALAVSRHAGELKIRLSAGGALLRHTGRDLREATCLVATGGVFEAAENPAEILETALDLARSHRALVPSGIPTFVDRQHVLAAAGLLDRKDPALAATLLRHALIEEEVERVA